MLTDALLADYITELHTEGKAPMTIAQVVAAAKWLAKNHGIEIVGEITSKTLAGIRRKGKERGHGQTGMILTASDRVIFDIGHHLSFDRE